MDRAGREVERESLLHPGGAELSVRGRFAGSPRRGQAGSWAAGQMDPFPARFPAQQVSRDQRGRVISATERIERSADTLAGARRTVAETEEVGP